MAKERLFSAEELAEMGKPTVEAIQEAIDQGDGEKAKKLSRRMYKEFLAMHDLYLHFVTGLLSYVGREYGDQALYAGLHEACAAFLRPLAEVYRGMEPRRRAELMASGLRGHLQPLKVEEDDEKFTFMMQPCGSGGRLLLQGAYDGPPNNFHKVGKAQPMTYGRENHPVYCVHCAFQEILPIEWEGVPLFITEPSANLGVEPCRIYIYKDPADIPARFYERIGKRKPA